MIVCHCRVVTHRDVGAAMRSGAASLASVCRTTGAGQDCGGCVFAVRRLVCEHGATVVVPTDPSTLSEVGVAAS